jgi:hypothetical protein
LEWRTLAALLIVIGLGVIALYGFRAFRAYREFQYIHLQGLDRGTAGIEAIRPWMTVRYIGVAYAVPEEYIYAQLNIPYNRRNVNETLRRLNAEYNLGVTPGTNSLRIVDLVEQAIRDYRANPVPTGLDQVRPWMTIRYIASSTGVPESDLLAAIGLDAAHAAQIDASVRPLDQLAPELQIKGGPKALFDLLDNAIDKYKAK